MPAFVAKAALLVLDSLEPQLALTSNSQKQVHIGVGMTPQLDMSGCSTIPCASSRVHGRVVSTSLSKPLVRKEWMQHKAALNFRHGLWLIGYRHRRSVTVLEEVRKLH